MHVLRVVWTVPAVVVGGHWPVAKGVELVHQIAHVCRVFSTTVGVAEDLVADGPARSIKCAVCSIKCAVCSAPMLKNADVEEVKEEEEEEEEEEREFRQTGNGGRGKK